MVEAGLNGEDMVALASALSPAGYRAVRVVHRDSLGVRCSALEERTGFWRTLRVVSVPVRRLSGLRRLWDGLLDQPRHPGLAAVVGHGTTADGRPWVATEGTELDSLTGRLASGAPLSEDDLEALATSIASALAALHRRGLVHGGVNPSAIVTTGSSWQLTDIGIARLVLPLPPPDPTSTVDEVGARAAPEVLEGAEVTGAGDVYALGATLAEAVTGQLLVPWAPGDTATALARRHRVAVPRLPPGLSARAAIEAACQADPRRRPAAEDLAALVGLAPAPAPDEDLTDQVLDDDVRFTVYRPATVPPERWCTMIAFAHKVDPADPSCGLPDPLEEVARQAGAVLGDAIGRYETAAEDSATVLARGAELSFVPQMDGVEFNPPSSSFRWLEAVHREEFRLRAAPTLAGRRARGRLSVFVGNLLVADVNLTIRVSDDLGPDDPPPRLAAEQARPYRRIFASYSHRDAGIVTQIGMIARVLGDEFVRDATHLRAGEVWSDRLEELVRSADVFQLFWSSSSMDSRFVRREWEYALSLGRESFVRPCYWEDPLPARPAEDLPPQTLQRLHFQRLPFSRPTPVGSEAVAIVPDAEAAATSRQEAENASRYAAARARQEAEEAEREAFRKRQEAAAALFEQPLAPDAPPLPGQLAPPTDAGRWGPAPPVPPPPSGHAQLPGAAEAKRMSPRPVAAAAPRRPGDLVCGSCGAGNDPARRFCRACGGTLIPAANVSPPPPWALRRRIASNLIGWLGVVVLLVALVTIGYLLVRSR